MLGIWNECLKHEKLIQNILEAESDKIKVDQFVFLSLTIIVIILSNKLWHIMTQINSDIFLD